MFQTRSYHFEHFLKFTNQRALDLRISRRLKLAPSSLGGVLVLGRCLFASAASHLIAGL